MINLVMTRLLGPSWRTTAGGIGSLLLGLGAAVNEIVNGHWPSVESTGLIMAGWTLIFARDGKVSDEKAGAKK